ncbi:MAG: hypothetical protein ACYDCC_03615 [Actinomycetota bacterium]
MKRGLILSGLATTVSGIVASVGVRSVWWRAITKGPLVTGIGRIRFPGGTFTQSAAGQFAFVSVSAALIVVAGVVSLMLKPSARRVVALIAIAASIHVLVIATISIIMHETLGGVHKVPIHLAPWVTSVVGATIGLIGSVLIAFIYGTVSRPMLPTSAPQSFEEPDVGVWE